MIYTAKAGLIKVPKILKGTAMHCDSLSVKQLRDMVCTRVLTLPFPAEVQNVGRTISGLFNQGRDAPLISVRACKVHELSTQTTNALLDVCSEPPG